MTLSQLYATYPWKENFGLDKIKYCPMCGTQLAREPVAQKIRPKCPQCGFVYYRNPYPTTSILVIEGDRVLLGKRSGEPGKGKWALPSGYIEFEDDFITTAVHEVKEETGLDIEVTSILNVQSAFLPPEYHFLGIYVLAKATGGRLAPSDELEEAGWFPISGPLPEMAFPPDVELIEAYASEKIDGIQIRADKS